MILSGKFEFQQLGIDSKEKLIEYCKKNYKPLKDKWGYSDLTLKEKSVCAINKIYVFYSLGNGDEYAINSVTKDIYLLDHEKFIHQKSGFRFQKANDFSFNECFLLGF